MNLQELIFSPAKLPNSMGVHIPGNFPNEEKFINQLAKIIHHSHTKHTNKQILFNLAGDGLEEILLEIVHKISISIHNRFNTCLSKFTILNACAPIYYNLQQYRKWCKLNNFSELKIVFTNNYEQLVRDELETNKDLYIGINQTPVLKPKKLMMLSRNCRPHKALAIAEMLKNNWLDQSYISFYSDIQVIKGQLKQTEHKNFLDYSFIIDKHADLFPISLNLDLSKNNTFEYGAFSTIEYFQNSYLNIVLESLFYENRNLNHYGYDSILMSEKIFKPIAMKQPFVVLARPGYLNALRGMGYKTFHPFINESYDTIQNDNERFDAVITELKRLMSFGDAEWYMLIKNLRDICKHNFMTLGGSDDVYYPEYLYSELV